MHGPEVEPVGHGAPGAERECGGALGEHREPDHPGHRQAEPAQQVDAEERRGQVGREGPAGEKDHDRPEVAVGERRDGRCPPRAGGPSGGIAGSGMRARKRSPMRPASTPTPKTRVYAGSGEAPCAGQRVHGVARGQPQHGTRPPWPPPAPGEGARQGVLGKEVPHPGCPRGARDGAERGREHQAGEQRRRAGGSGGPARARPARRAQHDPAGERRPPGDHLPARATARSGRRSGAGGSGSADPARRGGRCRRWRRPGAGAYPTSSGPLCSDSRTWRADAVGQEGRQSAPARGVVQLSDRSPERSRDHRHAGCLTGTGAPKLTAMSNPCDTGWRSRCWRSSRRSSRSTSTCGRRDTPARSPAPAVAGARPR